MISAAFPLAADNSGRSRRKGASICHVEENFAKYVDRPNSKQKIYFVRHDTYLGVCGRRLLAFARRSARAIRQRRGVQTQRLSESRRLGRC